jgi:hypothetical protein
MRADRKHGRSWWALAVAVLMAAPAMAEEPPPAAVDDHRIRELERRIDELEAGEDDRRGEGGSGWAEAWAEWTRRVRLGGSANTGYFWGSENNLFEDTGFKVWDARFFIDAELGSELKAGRFTLIRNAGFSFEWDLVRLGVVRKTVGDLYGELQGLGGSSWANVQLGRFQVPVGEAYLRYGRGYAKKPFISNVVGGAWFWDEGVKLYGADGSGRFGYVASLTTGETGFNTSLSGQKQYTLKLMTDPTPWLHLSVSGLYGGAIGTDAMAGSGGALWLGETWARTFGSRFNPFGGVPNYVDGVVVPDSPRNIRRTWYVGADAMIERDDRWSLWLSYGYFDIDQRDPVYDRALHQWVAELVLHGSLVSPTLSKLYVGVRANGLGTYDDGKGYLLDFRTESTLGYNTKLMEIYSFVVGWKLFRHVTTRLEYSYHLIGVVDGVRNDIAARAGSSHLVAFELGVHF